MSIANHLPWFLRMKENVELITRLQREEGRRTFDSSKASVMAFGHAFTKTYNALLKQSIVSEYPIGLKEVCNWMTNIKTSRRPQFAHVLTYFDLHLNPPMPKFNYTYIPVESLPACTFPYTALKKPLSTKTSLSYGASCKTYMFWDEVKNEDIVAKIGTRTTTSAIQVFWHEALILDHLQGVGGAPTLIANCEDYPCLFISYVKGKSLHTAYQNLSDRELVEVFVSIASNIEAIQRRGVIHNDIKSDNIIINIPQPEDQKIEARLIDFGNATLFNNPPYVSNRTCISYITYPWYAPEVYYKRGASFASDIFSFGMLIEDLFVKQIMSRDFKWPKGLEELIATMVEYKEDDRPSIKTVIYQLKHILRRMLKVNMTCVNSNPMDDCTISDEEKISFSNSIMKLKIDTLTYDVNGVD